MGSTGGSCRTAKTGARGARAGTNRAGNTLAADNKGQALYQDNSVVPHVTDAQQKSCIPSGLPSVVHTAAGIITLDGSRSACAERPRGCILLRAQSGLPMSTPFPITPGKTWQTDATLITPTTSSREPRHTGYQE